MIYDQKINWRDPKMQPYGLAFTQSRFKSAILDYQIQVEGELGDIVKRHFRDQEAYNIRRLQFQARVDLVRALIGEIPDDGFWDLIKSLGNLRNQYSHSRYTETTEGQKKIREAKNAILQHMQTIRPDIKPEMFPNDLEIITWANFMLQVFFSLHWSGPLVRDSA